MVTFSQLIKKPRNRYVWRTQTPGLKGCPQKKAICLKVTTVKPKKPNSAQRKIARVNVLHTNYKLTGYIPGEGHTLQQYSIVLFHGGRIRDLPGVRYKLVRGKFDLQGLKHRLRSRSRYGTKKWRFNAKKFNRFLL